MNSMPRSSPSPGDRKAGKYADSEFLISRKKRNLFLTDLSLSVFVFLSFSFSQFLHNRYRVLTIPGTLGQLVLKSFVPKDSFKTMRLVIM